jgi:hypothetical protein
LDLGTKTPGLKLSAFNILPPPAETLPAAVQRWRQLGLPLLLELLGGVRAAVEGGGAAGGLASGNGGAAAAGFGRAAAQQLFARAQAFLQVCNVLNEDYEAVRGTGCV